MFRSFSLVCALALGLTGTTMAQQGPAVTTAADLQTQLDAVKTERDQVASKVADLTGIRKDLEREVEGAKAIDKCWTGESAVKTACMLDVVANHAGTAAAKTAKDQVSASIRSASGELQNKPVQGQPNIAATPPMQLEPDYQYGYVDTNVSCPVGMVYNEVACRPANLDCRPAPQLPQRRAKNPPRRQAPRVAQACPLQQ